MRHQLIAILATALAATALPAKTTTQADPASTATAAKEEKKICKQVRRTETRMTDRVCMTKAQWKAVEDDS